MAENFLGCGWSMNVNVDNNGQIQMVDNEEEVKEAVYILLNTSKGERKMEPDFGCGIHEYVFSPVNTTTITLIKNIIKDSILEWEPRVSVERITIDESEINLGKLIINIEYLIKSTNTRSNLVYPFYIREE